jgi:hypothetical protein
MFLLVISKLRNMVICAAVKGARYILDLEE